MRALVERLAATLGPARVGYPAGPAFGGAEAVVHLADGRELAAVHDLAAAAGVVPHLWHGAGEPFPGSVPLLVSLRGLRTIALRTDHRGVPVAVQAGGGATLGEIEAALRRKGASLGARPRTETALPLGAWLTGRVGAAAPLQGIGARPRAVRGWRAGAPVADATHWHRMTALDAVVEAELPVFGGALDVRTHAYRFEEPRLATEALFTARAVDPEAELDLIAVPAAERAAIWAPETGNAGGWAAAAATVFPATAAWLDRWRDGESAACWLLLQVFDEPGVVEVRLAALDHALRQVGGHPADSDVSETLQKLLPGEAVFAEVAAARRGSAIVRGSGVFTRGQLAAWLARPDARRRWRSFRAVGVGHVAWRELRLAQRGTLPAVLPPPSGAPPALLRGAGALARAVRTGRSVALGGAGVVLAQGEQLWTDADAPWSRVERWLADRGHGGPMPDLPADASVGRVLAAVARRAGEEPSVWEPLGLRHDGGWIGRWLDGLGVVFADGRVLGADLQCARERDLRLDALACGDAHLWGARWHAAPDDVAHDHVWHGPLDGLAGLLDLMPRLVAVERLVVRPDADRLEVRLRLRGRRPLVRRALDRLHRALPGLRPLDAPWPRLAEAMQRHLQRWSRGHPLPDGMLALVDLDEAGGHAWVRNRP